MKAADDPMTDPLAVLAAACALYHEDFVRDRRDPARMRKHLARLRMVVVRAEIAYERGLSSVEADRSAGREKA